jgi:hypothetical protein
MNRKTVFWIIGILAGLCLLGIIIGGVAMLLVRPAQEPQSPEPVVQIFYPPDMGEVPFGSVIPGGVEAFVPEGNQVTLLQLWADGELVGEMAGSDVALTASWGWTPAHASMHTLVGRALNQEGVEGSAIISIDVRQDLPDTDQDGIADEQDDCPDEVGAPEWNGCPPGGELGDAWAPGDGLTEEMLEAIAEALGEGLPSGDPPVVEEDPDPPEPPPTTSLEVEALRLVSAVGARDVYCYLTLTSRPLERVPSDAEGEFSESVPMSGDWNIPDFMGGANGRMVDVPETGPLHMEMDCWGHFSDDPLDPDVRHMGFFSADHGPGDWDGRELIGHGAMDANWFDLTYRICPGNCEETTLPTPYNLNLTFVGPDYHLSWQWDEDPSVDNSDVGFHVYRDGIPIVTVPGFNPVLNVIPLLAGDVEPPLCNQEYRFEVRAVRGADVQLSAPSNTVWSISPDPCDVENRLTLTDTEPVHDTILHMTIQHYYIGSHTERVMVGGFPLIDGIPADASLFTWHGASVGVGGGTVWNYISYSGTEPLATNGLRLFMLTVADGINPGGDMVFFRDMPFDFTWQPGVPDLRIQHLYYPEGDDVLRIQVRNAGAAPLEGWLPTFAFFQEELGVRTRVPGLDSPPGLLPQTIEPFNTVIVRWPDWGTDEYILLHPQYEVEVDPDNLVAESNEENNVYLASKPDKQITIEQIRVIGGFPNDAAGFPGCFVGLDANIDVGTESLILDGVGKKMEYPTVNPLFPWADTPHELGIMGCPDQYFDLETELIPALNAGSCAAACSGYFGAHAQPIFAEGKHIFWPVSAWGDDYCSACYTLSGQTYVNRATPVFNYAYSPGDDLEIDVRIRDIDIMPDETTHFNVVCNYTGVIPAVDMAALPIVSRELTDPGGNCAIVVTVENLFP